MEFVVATFIPSSHPNENVCNPGALVSLGHNLGGDTSCADALTGAGDINSTNPLLGPDRNAAGEPLPPRAGGGWARVLAVNWSLEASICFCAMRKTDSMCFRAGRWWLAPAREV